MTPKTLAPVVLLLLLASTLVFAAGSDGEENAEIGPIDPRLLGVWQQIDAAEDAEAKTVEVTASHWSVATGEKLQYRSPVIGQRGDELVLSVFCNRQPHRVELGEKTLKVTTTRVVTKFNPDPEEETERYVRVSERPEVFDLEPLPLGDPDRPLPKTRIEGIRKELEERGERDQAVREIFTKPGAQPTPDDSRRMGEVDKDNTTYLREIVAEVGWIDDDRFGPEAAEAAWLIVQHSGDLRLMKTVLPVIEERVRADEDANGDRYALLYDRTQLWLGHEQRYGSQVFFGPEGMFLAPLEDPAGVDQRRAELGMSSLAEYLERFRERNDGRPVPIRTEF